MKTTAYGYSKNCWRNRDHRSMAGSQDCWSLRAFWNGYPLPVADELLPGQGGREELTLAGSQRGRDDRWANAMGDPPQTFACG